MNRHARRPITFTATATQWGRVEFDVEQVGAFTVAFGANGYPHDCDTERLEVVYGRWTDDQLFGRARDLDGAPVINGIRLVGGSVFDPDQALAHLRETENDWCGWLTVFRRNASWSEQVPWKTKERAAYIVARLVEAFLERADVDELLAAHRAHHAPARIARHEDNLRRVEAELTEWRSRRALERQQLDRQLAFARAEEQRSDSVGSPRWRDYSTAATRDGEMFLISTVGARRPA
jgi:hypothetical protein